jgi:hypothetical protein
MPRPPCLQSPTMSDAGAHRSASGPPRRSRAAVAGRQRRHPNHRVIGKCLTAARMALDVERGCWSSPVRRGPPGSRSPTSVTRGSGLRQSCLRHRCSDPLVARRDRQHGCGSRVQPSQPGEDNGMRSSRAWVVQSMIFERRLGSRRAAESLPRAFPTTMRVVSFALIKV